ncbi:MAG: hypothetical protein JOZ69_17535, partial [Myxococcales bacterium]|nr:hypothetical protein [Myxococcales bacterium]
MVRGMRHVTSLRALALGACLLGAGCEEKKTGSEPARTDGGGASADKYATADPKLAKALQAAASASASPNGPPPDGIFPEGAADKRHPRGTPTSVEVIAEGSEPRVSLSGGAGGDASADRRPSIFGPAALELALQFGPRSALAV